jgi:hypothetical protein
MRRFLCFSLVSVTCLCLLIATERQALAYYVDPGSGLFVVQSAASILATVGYFMRRRIRSLFGGSQEPANKVSLSAEKDGARKQA